MTCSGLGLTGTTSIKALFQRVRSLIDAENGRSLPNITELTPSPNYANIENGLIRPTSTQNRIKTSLRNRLKIQTLDKLVRLSYRLAVNVTLKTDFEAAADIFLSKTRRL